jgi:ABC-type branched-subunit amino acid transport system substrate-binding protein
MSAPARPEPDPIIVGLLFDFPQGDGGDSIETAVRMGLEDAVAGGGLDRPVTFVRELSRGLPLGSAAALERSFASLVHADVLAVVGPSISDNGLIARDLADEAQIPCINYTGGELTRSAWMFHYQVGSLEEEPVVLAEMLEGRGLHRVAVVYDASPVGRRYVESFEAARSRLGLVTTASAAISPVSTDAADVVGRLRSSSPDALMYLGLGMAARTVALALEADGWKLPVVANSALMFGYARPDWRPGWEGWVYVDTVADDNPGRQALAARSRATAAGPVGVAAYDIGRLLGEALARCQHLTRHGVRDALESVKRLPATSGSPGTIMGFGCWDHAALKGPYLVLRQWHDGKTVPYGTTVR